MISRLTAHLSIILAAVLATSCGDPSLVLNPSEGGKNGGTDVRIEGRGFVGHGPPVVHFGDAPAKAVVIESDRLIRVKAPEVEATGVVDVTITFSDGVAHRLPGAFAYTEQPVLQIVAPGG